MPMICITSLLIEVAAAVVSVSGVEVAGVQLDFEWRFDRLKISLDPYPSISHLYLEGISESIASVSVL